MRILVVDDDERFRTQLTKALVRRGHRAESASGTSSALEVAAHLRPDAAVLDLKMPRDNGIVLMERLMEPLPNLNAVILTGFGNIATAVQAVRKGATNYLTKPADADEVLTALGEAPPVAEREESIETPTLDRVEWEHIHRVLEACGGNVSETARRLGIHRRSLQRKLSRYPSPR